MARQGAWSRKLLTAGGTIEVWVVLSLLFVGLVRLGDPAAQDVTNVWFLDPLMSVVFLAMMWRNRRSTRRWSLYLTRRQAACAFVSISWIVAMLYELTISRGGGEYGGMHDRTLPSFIIAQGFYVPLAVLGLWLVRRYQLSFRELFFVAGMTCLYEALVVGLPAVLSGMIFVSPIIIAYYFVVYSRFLSFGLLFVDERLLWSDVPRPIPFFRKLLYGCVLSIICWTIFVMWGESMSYVFYSFGSGAIS